MNDENNNTIPCQRMYTSTLLELAKKDKDIFAVTTSLAIGVGLAMAAKMDLKSYKTYVLMRDGEQGEGSIYVAAMAANHYKLDNLIAIIDRNELQISGKTEEIMSLEPLRQRWESFGWDVTETDGNDMEAIVNAFEIVQLANRKPKLIIAHTAKGSGISYMEKVAKWHHGVPNEMQFQEALSEINVRIKSLSKQ